MKKQRPTIPAHNKALYVAFTLLMVASASLKAATTYDTFTTNPNISTEWTHYAYMSTTSAPPRLEQRGSGSGFCETCCWSVDGDLPQRILAGGNRPGGDDSQEPHHDGRQLRFSGTDDLRHTAVAIYRWRWNG